MYLSIDSIHKLDNLLKDFEVAYRSFVVDEIKRKFPTQSSFEKQLSTLLPLLSGNSLLNSPKYKGRITETLKQINRAYSTIEACHSAFVSKTVPENVMVPYVSTIIEYIEILFEPYFRNSKLLNGFSVKDFFFLSYNFHKVRNDLSHPASSKVSLQSAKEVIRFIEKVTLNLDDSYYWYSNKDSIRKSIEVFLNSIFAPSIAIHNLNEITYTHKKLIQRETELKELKELIFGKEGYEHYRKARSVVIYGYGGLGKTALVLEFINDIVKDYIDTKNSKHLDFLLYFTAKEEELTFSSSTNEFQINEIKKQISSYQNFVDYLLQYLNIEDLKDISKYRGLLVIDNIETLKADKAKIIEFIRTLPDSIQVILTSREEEIADSKMALKGYEDIQSARSFVKEYIDEYYLNLEYKEEYDEIILGSKGNTLILILSLLRLNEHPDSYPEIIKELNSTSSASISAAANFMYKNTFDQAIHEIEQKGIDPKKILSVIAYYGEPIDLYSLSKLAGIKSMSTVETVCDILLQKLVLTKKYESYEINEFASKFIIVKIIPNKIEAQVLTNRIGDFKYNKRKILRNLEENRNNVKLNKIMMDWAPRNNIEKIAIAEAYGMYSVAVTDDSKNLRGRTKVEYIIEKFKEIESYSPHPYVKFQKARIFSALLKKSLDQTYYDIITKAYEDAIFSVKFDYQYIARTQSFAVVLWFYAMFLMKEFEEYAVAARNLEEAKSLYESLNLKNDNYGKTLVTLRDCYQGLFKRTKDRAYLSLRDSITNKLPYNQRSY